MEGISKVMTLITVMTVVMISYTIFINSQKYTLLSPDKEFIDTFIFEEPLKKVVVNYENPEKKILEVEEENNYRGTKISLGEYNFRIRGNVTNVTYYFEFPERLIKENDVKQESIELYTVLDGKLVKAGGKKENNSIVLTTKKLIPLLILADPNDFEGFDEKELYYNSRSKSSIAYEKIVSFFRETKNQIITGFILLGLVMTSILIYIERSRLPKDKNDKRTIREYVEHVRSEGLSDEEIIANLIERGIKASHAELLVKKRR